MRQGGNAARTGGAGGGPASAFLGGRGDREDGLLVAPRDEAADARRQRGDERRHARRYGQRLAVRRAGVEAGLPRVVVYGRIARHLEGGALPVGDVARAP